MAGERQKQANETSRIRVTAREREAQALELRKRGYNYRQIAKALDVSVSSAHKMIRRVLSKLAQQTSEDAEIVTRLELDRLDALLAGCWEAASKGDVQALYAALKISERRMRILGIERERVEMSGPGGGPIETVSGYDKVQAILDKYGPPADPPTVE